MWREQPSSKSVILTNVVLSESVAVCYSCIFSLILIFINAFWFLFSANSFINRVKVILHSTAIYPTCNTGNLYDHISNNSINSDSNLPTNTNANTRHLHTNHSHKNINTDSRCSIEVYFCLFITTIHSMELVNDFSHNST